MAEDLKAYAVTENYESTGGIVFAKHAVTARRIGADQWADGEFSEVSCRRAPWADHCAADGIVPASICIANGWHFECSYCSRRIDRDQIPYRTWSPADVVGSQHSAVFCDRSCQIAHARTREHERRLKARVLAHYSKRLTKRLPGISIRGLDDAFRGSHVYVTHAGRVEQVVIDFDWPGQTIGPASFRWDKRSKDTGLRCCAGELSAFVQFADSVGTT